MKKAAPFVLLIVLFAVAAWYFFTREPDVVQELPPALPAETQQIEVSPGDVPVEPETEIEPEPESEPEYLLIGRVRRAHGVRGEVAVEILSEVPERFDPGSELVVSRER